MGSRVVEIRYADGEREHLSVTVRNGATVSASFRYTEPSPQPTTDDFVGSWTATRGDATLVFDRRGRFTLTENGQRVTGAFGLNTSSYEEPMLIMRTDNRERLSFMVAAGQLDIGAILLEPCEFELSGDRLRIVSRWDLANGVSGSNPEVEWRRR